MIKETKHMNKLIIVPGDMDFGRWTVGAEDLFRCYNCQSTLFYIRERYGVVEEDSDFQIMNNQRKSYYVFRVIGIRCYCAECGEFNEDYNKWMYPVDKTVYTFDDEDFFDEDDRMEVMYCISQYNQRKKYIPNFKSMVAVNVKKALDEYEEKHYRGKNVQKMSAHKKV